MKSARDPWSGGRRTEDGGKRGNPWADCGREACLTDLKNHQ